MRGRIIVLPGNSNPQLSEKVCSYLDMTLGQALVARFSDGEVRVEIQENLRGMDVFVIQSTCPPVNDNLVELLVMIDAIKRASARRVNAVIPYYGYGRQDQKEKPRVSITAKVVADLLSVAGADRIITVSLHADQIQGFFSIPMDHLLGTEMLVQDLKKRLEGNEVVVAPDAGGVERARRFAALLKVDLAIVDHRGTEEGARGSIVGKVKDRPVILLDDMVDTGRTLIRASKGAQDAGAASIDAYCVHAVLSEDAVKNLEASPLRSLTVTDTAPLSKQAMTSRKIRTVSVAPLLAEAIRRVHYEESISSLFA